MQAAALKVAWHGLPAPREITPPAAEREVEWHLDRLSGRFVELCGGADSAALSAAAGLLVQAQQQGGLAAWLRLPGSFFFPPDLAACGADLAALPIVAVPDAAAAARAADQLIRSGAFALVVMDLSGPLLLPLPVQTRLAGLAKRHNTALVVLTKPDTREQQRGSLVSLRAHTRKRRVGPNMFHAEIEAEKDKRRAPGWKHQEVHRGPYMCNGLKGGGTEKFR